jgi:hypothetical protein
LEECSRRIVRYVNLGLNRRWYGSGLLSESVHEAEGQQSVMVKGPHLRNAFVQLVYIGGGIAQWRSTVETYARCLLHEEHLRKDAALFMAFSKLLEDRMGVVEV